MKISNIFKSILALVLLNSLSCANPRDECKDETLTRTANTSTDVQASDTTPSIPRVSGLSYYVINPVKAFGVGVFMGLGAPFAGAKEFYYAIRGSEIYEKLNNRGVSFCPKVYDYRSLDTNERWYKARQGFVYTAGAPLVGVAFFLLSLRSFNNPGGSL